MLLQFEKKMEEQKYRETDKNGTKILSYFFNNWSFKSLDKFKFENLSCYLN